MERLANSRWFTVATLLLATGTVTASSSPRDQALTQNANEAFGLDRSAVVELPIDRRSGEPMLTAMVLDGVPVVMHLEPHSVRSAQYKLVVQDETGEYEVAPGPERTVRGSILGMSGSIVAGSLSDDGLRARVVVPHGEYWIEPLSGRVAGAGHDHHVVYSIDDVVEMATTCGTEAMRLASVDLPAAPPPATGGFAGAGGACVAELACDADYEYFQTYGSVGATEAQINSIINAVNLQYEAQVGITHQITTIIVRTTNNDPYSKKKANQLLCEFITEWTNNQQSEPRDLAHLFTGKALAGSTIGIASDIGGTGVCVSQGACTGGTYGTQGSYCLAESNFASNFACKTDLTAHEAGHLWGAFHCSCSGNTMNSSITCANNFSAGSINSITAYRDSRSCLDSCGGGTPTGGCCDGSTCTIETAAACSSLGGTYLGDGSNCSGSPCGPVTGACCASDDTCTVATSADCASAGSVYQGDGTDCSPNPCGGPVQAAIDSATVNRGSIVSGFLESLEVSDDDVVVIDAQRQGQRYRVELRTVLSNPFSAAAQLDVTTEVGASATGVTTDIALLNYATGQFNVIDSYNQPTGDTVRNTTVTSGASNYLSATGEITVRIFMQKQGGDYLADIDQVQVIITP